MAEAEGGRALMLSPSPQGGGAINIEYGVSVTFVSCTFSGNDASGSVEGRVSVR